jgi:hypothetical protein
MRTAGKPGKNRHAPPNKRRQIVREMAAAGISGDVIAARLRLNKNALRAGHALDLDDGRKTRQAEKAAAAESASSKADAEQLERIQSAFASDWYDPQFGCDLFGGAKTIEEAIEWCRKFKG